MVDALSQATGHSEVKVFPFRNVLLALLFGAGIVFALIFMQSSDTSRVANVVADRFDVSLPQSDYSPSEVVTRQMESLRASTRDIDRLVECYSYASPANRGITGPFENFANLVLSEPYDEMALCKEYQVGTPVIDGNDASVLVSLLTVDDAALAFRFILSKQSSAPYEGCWMTEGVYPLIPEGMPAAMPDEEPESVLKTSERAVRLE